MEVANASMYDGSTACAEAADDGGAASPSGTRSSCPAACTRTTPTPRDPHVRSGSGIKVIRCLLPWMDELDVQGSATTSPASSSNRPNVFGTVTDLTKIAELPRQGRAAGRDVHRGRLARPDESPGEMGADIVAAKASRSATFR
jgi:glycine dehydrogenase subunit 1